LGYCTVVLFPLEDGWALFDTGHYGDRHLLLSAIKRINLSPDSIRHVILSHLHYDHSLNVSLFTKAIVYVSRAELNYAQKISAGEASDLFIPDFWSALLENHRVFEVDKDLQLSQTKQLRVLPGHTPGCMAMFCKVAHNIIAVCGDVIKNAWEAVSGKSGMALAGEAIAGSSIQTILQEASVIIPGHDNPFVINNNGVTFITPFHWKVLASLYPGEQGQTVTSLYRPSGKNFRP